MTTGKVTRMLLNIDSPMKMENLEITMNSLNVFVGKNGSGKSLVLKLQWAVSFITQAVIAGARGTELQILSQYVFDNTLVEQNINGTIANEFESGVKIVFNFLDGKVTSVFHDGEAKVTELTRVVYISSAMRLFSDIGMYLKVRRAHKDLSDELRTLEMIKGLQVIRRALRRIPIA